ncbi:hypothetical protein [Burkholderia sp. LMG 21824]|uniref:hypothetical protein n=1 Tax=Burkholderia sp. LMG 21824 TaxID=3158172 RepID=UPI003C2BC2A1
MRPSLGRSSKAIRRPDGVAAGGGRETRALAGTIAIGEGGPLPALKRLGKSGGVGGDARPADKPAFSNVPLAPGPGPFQAMR